MDFAKTLVVFSDIGRRPISQWDRGQIGIKQGTKHVIHQKVTNVM